MYESFFLLRQRPFTASPDLYHYFPSTIAEQARDQLIQCIEHGSGPALLIGPPGTGKSLLCQLLADHFQAAHQIALLSHSTVCTRRALFQSLLYALRCRTKGSSEGALRLGMWHHLESKRACPNGVLAIIDEAHKLPIALLEELRVLTNCVVDGEPRFRLILAGGAALEERFADPELETFNQRLGTRAYLQPLSREETAAYVRARIAAADGMPDDTFTDDALRAIYYATDGVPRLINQLGDAALTLATRQQRKPIDRELLEQAWADLQQLPSPVQTPPETNSSTSSFIEFGELDGAADHTSSTPVVDIEEGFGAASYEFDASHSTADQETDAEEHDAEETATIHNAYYDQVRHVAAQLDRPRSSEPTIQPAAEPAAEPSIPAPVQASAIASATTSPIANPTASRRLKFRFDPPASELLPAHPAAATLGTHNQTNSAVPAPHFRVSQSESPATLPHRVEPTAAQPKLPQGHELLIVPDEEESREDVASRRPLDRRSDAAQDSHSDQQPSRANRMDYRLLFAQLRRRS